MSTKKRQDVLPTIAEQITHCTACQLHQTRTKAIVGEGSTDAALFFVTEAPVFHEDKQGRPLVGSVGRLFDTLLDIIGLTRADVFIGPIVRCRPPENRAPLSSEIDTCATYIQQQLDAIQPRIVVTLGRQSTAAVFPDKSLARIHGQPQYLDDGRVYFPVFHPADVLRNPSLRPMIEGDFLNLRTLLDEVLGNTVPFVPEKRLAKKSRQPAEKPEAPTQQPVTESVVEPETPIDEDAFIEAFAEEVAYAEDTYVTSDANEAMTLPSTDSMLYNETDAAPTEAVGEFISTPEMSASAVLETPIHDETLDPFQEMLLQVEQTTPKAKRSGKSKKKESDKPTPDPDSEQLSLF